MSTRIFTLLFLSFFHLPASAQVNTAACARIQESYSLCKTDNVSGVSYSGNTFRMWRNGKTITVACDDGKNLGFYDRVENMDIASIMEFPYLSGDVPLPTTSEAGRLRNQTLFKAIYGTNAAEVRANLRTVHFLPNMPLEFNSKNGAANSLEDAGRDLQIALHQDSQFAKQMSAWSKGENRGTFEWRLIAGTKILSSHSFGTAVDFVPVETSLPEYWRWNAAYDTLPERDIKNYQAPARIATFPLKLVQIMEAHGFIWGGKWYHFDSMHFEYRPEFTHDYSPRCQ